MCPNGMGCLYRHCLPPGYVLKSAVVKKDDGDEIAIEDIIDEERANLGDKRTPVTLENFTKWKEEKKKMREQEIETKRKEEAKKTGSRGLHVLSGRALFTFDPT